MNISSRPLGLRGGLPYKNTRHAHSGRSRPCVATLSPGTANPVAVRLFCKSIGRCFTDNIPPAMLNIAAGGCTLSHSDYLISCFLCLYCNPFPSNPCCILIIFNFSIMYPPAAAPLFHHPVAALHPVGANAALLTLASFMTLALSMGGVVYYGARTAWERLEPWVTSTASGSTLEPESLYGIDVTGSKFFNRPTVQRAVEFAAAAHKGQVRKTQEPYVAHCVATAAIVEGLLAPTEDDSRAEAAVITALLHDVLDDAGADLGEIESEFGTQVASMVSKVSQLSATNQLVRRRIRLNAAEPTAQEAAQLRHMILTMISEPLVIVVKLADRLHNMRTVYALPAVKQRAVADETRRVWCSLAERLGMFALKSELEDLCFAVLQPEEYRALRAELDEMWGLESIPAAAMEPIESWDLEAQIPLEQLDVKSGGEPGWLGAAHATLPSAGPSHSFEAAVDDENTLREEAAAAVRLKDPEAAFLTQEQLEVRDLVRSVLPFDASTFNMGKLNIPPSARRGLEVLQGTARALLQEITTEGVAAGLEISVQGRVKSLFSAFKKMARKGVPLTQVYDARALRVVVEDSGGAREREAIAACYKLLPAVHRLWKKVDGEDDDYIAQPKGSGYQSLHTAVMGPGGVPMEVQIRTASMHDMAEYGRAAHWAYKETTPIAGTVGAPPREGITAGQPVLRISPGGQLRDGVVVSSENEGMRLLVAVSLTERRFQSAHTTKAAPMEYSALLDYVIQKGYFLSGQGDMMVSLELFTLCSDGKYHRIDQFGHKLPTVAVPLAAMPLPTSAPEEEQSKVLLASSEAQGEDLGEGRPNESIPSVAGAIAGPLDEATYLNNRIRLLRSMLEWGADIGSQAPPTSGDTTSASSQSGGAVGAVAGGASSGSSSPTGPGGGSILPGHELAWEQPPQDVMVLVWPSGKILRVPRGTTAGAVARREGCIGRRSGIVNVNNRLVPEGTSLEDGDYVVLTQETVKV